MKKDKQKFIKRFAIKALLSAVVSMGLSIGLWKFADFRYPDAMFYSAIVMYIILVLFTWKFQHGMLHVDNSIFAERVTGKNAKVSSYSKGLSAETGIAMAIAPTLMIFICFVFLR